MQASRAIISYALRPCLADTPDWRAYRSPVFVCTGMLLTKSLYTMFLHSLQFQSWLVQYGCNSGSTQS